MNTVKSTRMATVEESLALFADVLLLGVMTSIVSLGVVTAYPAFVAACRRSGPRGCGRAAPGTRSYLFAVGTVLRSGPLPYLFVPALVAWLALALLGVQSGVPGASVLTPLTWAIAVVLLVIAGRAATTWTPGEPWVAVARRAASLTVADPIGSLMLAGALVVAAGIGVSVPVLLPLLPGALALAGAAVEHRWASREYELRDER